HRRPLRHPAGDEPRQRQPPRGGVLDDGWQPDDAACAPGRDHEPRGPTPPGVGGGPVAAGPAGAAAGRHGAGGPPPPRPRTGRGSTPGSWGRRTTPTASTATRTPRPTRPARWARAAMSPATGWTPAGNCWAR